MPDQTKRDSQGHRIVAPDGSKEGAGGWAALATQRSTRHIVDPNAPKTHGPSGAKVMITDPNNSKENPVTLEDQLSQLNAAKEEVEQLQNVNPGESRAEGNDHDPAAHDNEDDEDEDEGGPVDAEKMTKDELLAEAEKRGVDVKSNMTKSEIADAINEADEDAEGDEDEEADEDTEE